MSKYLAFQFSQPAILVIEIQGVEIERGKSGIIAGLFF
jgi:hypothetical protein